MIDKKVTLLFIVGLKAPVICPRFEQQKTMWKKDKGGIFMVCFGDQCFYIQQIR